MHSRFPASALLARLSRAVRPLLVAGALVVLAAHARAQQHFTASLWGWEVVPPVSSPGIGSASMTLDTVTRTLYYHIEWASLSSAQTDCHFRGPAPSGQVGPIMFHVHTLGSPLNGSWAMTPTQISHLQNGLIYIEIETENFPNGEIRGQIHAALPPPSFPYCFGDGTGTACPCGNASAPGNQEGCLNSFGTGGKLVSTGVASAGVDTLVLHGTGMTNGAALYFQGTARVNGRSGSVFGDGLRCAAGTVIRLGTTTNSAGASQYPDAGDMSISVKGLIPAGGQEVRDYQVWYRNSASFCTPSGFNLTNGLEVVWVP